MERKCVELYEIINLMEKTILLQIDEVSKILGNETDILNTTAILQHLTIELRKKLDEALKEDKETK